MNDRPSQEETPGTDPESAATPSVLEQQNLDNPSYGKPALDPSPGHFPWPRVRLPLLLFVVTCLSTFYRGVRHWIPWVGWGEGVDGKIFEPSISNYDPLFFGGIQIRRDLMLNLDDGLIYMGGLLAILLAHELGHFIMTRIYRVPASFPLFIPMPFSLIGTMGAVILMDPRKADRKMMFDIGLAGPLAGLVVAAPLMLVGMLQLHLDKPPLGMELGMPLLVQKVLPFVQPAYHGQFIALNQISPLFMAGWVGFLITGLNMLPVGQLDGGHVTYALFGKGAHWIARILMGIVFAAMAWSYYDNSYGSGTVPPYYQWVPMALIVYFIGIYHPPTADDNVELGPVRTVIGLMSLAIAPLTFTPALFLMQ